MLELQAMDSLSVYPTNLLFTKLPIVGQDQPTPNVRPAPAKLHHDQTNRANQPAYFYINRYEIWPAQHDWLRRYFVFERATYALEAV